MYTSLIIIAIIIAIISKLEGKLHISTTSGHAVSSAYIEPDYDTYTFNADQDIAEAMDMINRGERS